MKPDILIIGAGIAGISAAYYLNRAGYDVTVVDRSSVNDGCSYGNAGMIVPSHIIPLSSPGVISKGLKWMLDSESPFYIRPRLSKELLQWGWKFKKASTHHHVEESGPVLRDLLIKSRELLIDLEKTEKLDFGFVKKGLFMFCNTQKGLEEEIEAAEKANALGVPAEILTPEQVKKVEPDVEMELVGATYYPNDAHLHPASLTDQLKNLLKARGVIFETNMEITSFHTEGDRITAARSKEGTLRQAGRFIICSGAWSAALARTLGRNIPIQAGKGYSITLNDPKILPEHCGIFSEAKVTMTPMFDNTLRFGGTMEITGTDQSINPKKIAGLKKAVCNFLPQFDMRDFDGHPVWAGLRPCSPDGLPYAGRSHAFKNLYFSTGHAMMGMSLAPACGELIADLISKGRSDLEHPLIHPDRYS